MRERGCSYSVNRLADYTECGGEAEGDVCIGYVIVDSLGNADYSDALSCKVARAGKGAVAADNYESINTEVLKVLDGNVADVLVLNIAVFITVSVVEKVVFVGILEDGTALIEDVLGVFSGKLHIIVEIEACVALLEADNLTAVLVDSGKCYSSYYGIKTGTVAAACQNANSFNLRHSFFSNLMFYS